jgi:N4-gp56 family major capsid protein
MAIATYSGGNRNPRNVILESELLPMLGPVTCIDQFFHKINVPAKEGDTIMLQRAIVPSTVIAQVAEGVNPAGRELVYETFQKQLEEYAESFNATSRAVELGQTDVVKDQADVLKELISLTREALGWAGVIAGGNVIYNAAAIVSRVTVNGAISGGRLAVATRFLSANKVKYFYEVSKGALEDNTTPVEESVVCLSHTDTESDIRALSGFRNRSEVGGMKGPKNWFGNWQKITFVTSPEFSPILAGGAVIGATGMKSVAGVNIDVYPYVLLGQKAVGRCGLRGSGKGGTGGVKAYTVNGADHADPTGQRVINSARWWDGMLITQPLHLIRIECGVTANPTS